MGMHSYNGRQLHHKNLKLALEALLLLLLLIQY
jgi:hypothetical protein